MLTIRSSKKNSKNKGKTKNQDKMTTIAIDNGTCIRCSKCVKVCPAMIFTQEDPKAEVRTINVSSCIGCSHCVVACPTDSVHHSDFSANKVHALNRDILPQPEQLMELLRARRSNRAFLSTPVPEDFLNQIVNAAYLAPTASNGQEVAFTLVTNSDLLNKISQLSISIFEATLQKLKNPLLSPIISMAVPGAKKNIPKLQHVIDSYKGGYDIILRNAKAVLFIHTPANSNFGRQDANLAYQNASLMAESLGVSQFYTGFVCGSVDMDKKKNQLAKLLNIEGRRIHAGMAMAMPAFKFPKYADRKDIQLTILK